MRASRLFCLLPLLAMPVWAATTCQYDYAVRSDLPSLYQRQPDGQETGLQVALAQRISSLSGCALRAVMLPNARRDAMFLQGRLMLQFPVLEDPSLVRTGDEFVPMIQLALRVSLLAPDGPAPMSADAVLQQPLLTLGMVRGTHLPPEVRQRLGELSAFRNVEFSNERSSLYQKLARQRVQAVLDPVSWLPTGVPALAGKTLRLPFQPPLYVRVGGYLSRDLPEADRQRLRQALQQLVADGTVMQLTRQHLPIDQTDLRGP